MALLIEKLKQHYKEKNTLKSLIFQNCMLDVKRLNLILSGLGSIGFSFCLKSIDVANNRIHMKASTGRLISKLLGSLSNKPKVI